MTCVVVAGSLPGSTPGRSVKRAFDALDQLVRIRVDAAHACDEDEMKSPARVPRFQVPVGLLSPAGASVFTPLGEICCAVAEPAPIPATQTTIATKTTFFMTSFP